MHTQIDRNIFEIYFIFIYIILFVFKLISIIKNHNRPNNIFLLR